MNLDPATLALGLTIGSAIGCIAGALRANKLVRELREAAIEARVQLNTECHGYSLTIREQGRRIAELLAEKSELAREVLSRETELDALAAEKRYPKPLRERNEKAHAAKLAREAQAKELRQKRLAEMRELTGHLV